MSPLTGTTPAERALEHMNSAVLLLSDGCRVIYLNAAAQMLFAVSDRQVRDQGVRSALPNVADFLESAWEHAVDTGEPFTQRELRVEATANRYVTVDMAVTPVEETEVLVEFSQLDRRLRITREQHLIAQNQATRDLLRGLAHEIKNPLGGLRGAAQLLDRALEADEHREYTRVIIEEADRLRSLVNGLLGPAGRPNKRDTNVHEIMERVRQLAEAEAPSGVTLYRDYDPSIPPLKAEPNQLIQAVLNIVRNALQAVGDAGHITLRTRTQRQFTIGDVPHRLVVRIDIIDSGPGIPPQIMDRLFYPMVTSRPEGTGLGLSIAQTLVNQHGGLIECWSEPGHTEFTIWLPLEVHNDG